jgi:hypothetical protein
MADRLKAAAEAEGANPDPLEEEAVIEDVHFEDSTPLTTSVRRSLG